MHYNYILYPSIMVNSLLYFFWKCVFFCISYLFGAAYLVLTLVSACVALKFIFLGISTTFALLRVFLNLCFTCNFICYFISYQITCGFYCFLNYFFLFYQNIYPYSKENKKPIIYIRSLGGIDYFLCMHMSIHK